MNPDNRQKNIIAIECAVANGSVSVVSGGAAISVSGEDVSPSRAEEVLTVITSVLADAKMELSDIDEIAVSTGPGSYSGMRIGIATALGLKNSLNVPCLGVSVLHAMALSVDRSDSVICAIPVGKNDIAWQLFPREEGPRGPELSSEVDFVQELAAYSDSHLYVHSGLVTRLHSQPVTPIGIGTNLSVLIANAIAAGYGDSDLTPLYLRNRSHAFAPTFQK